MQKKSEDLDGANKGLKQRIEAHKKSIDTNNTGSGSQPEYSVITSEQ